MDDIDHTPCRFMGFCRGVAEVLDEENFFILIPMRTVVRVRLAAITPTIIRLETRTHAYVWHDDKESIMRAQREYLEACDKGWMQK